jgi:type IV pilus assembly protein PilF
MILASNLEACVVLAGALALFAGGCTQRTTQPGDIHSPERQSETEYMLAKDYFYKGDPRQALDHVLRAVQLNSDNPRALYFASTVFLYFCSTDQGMASPDCRLADAEKYARLAVQCDPKFRDAKNLLGQTLILEGKKLADAGDAAGASKAYKEAIEVLRPLVDDPAYSSNFLAWGNLGWAQVLSGDVDTGIASLKNSVTQPRFCVGHYRLGLAYEKKGNLVEAETSLSSAVQVQSTDCQNLQDGWYELGTVRAKLGKPDDARVDFQRCKEISADSPTGKRCVQMLAGMPAAPSAPTPPQAAQNQGAKP